MANMSAARQVTALRSRTDSLGSRALQVARFELLRQFRRRRIFLLLTITGVLAAALFAAVQIFGTKGNSAYSYASTYVSFVTILAALAATFFGADALVGEFEHRTGYLLFTQPVTRTSVFLGKLLAALASAFLTIAAYYAITAAATLGVIGSLPAEIGYSFGLALLYTAAALGVAVLFSSVVKSTATASVLTFSVLFFVLFILEAILSQASVRPDGNLSFAGWTISAILAGPYPDAYPGDSAGGGQGPGFSRYSPAVGTSIYTMIAWISASLLLALFFYHRREMKG